MEGPRLPPSAATTTHDSDDDKPDDHPSVWHRPTSSLPTLPSEDPPPHHWRNHSLNLSPVRTTSLSHLPPPDSIPELETYVVQVPRDQVYWTPPPEHAKYVEKRRRNNPHKNKKKGCSTCLMWFIIISVVLGFILGTIILILHVSFNPALPAFRVERLTVKPSSSGVTLRAKNPTSNMGVTYSTTKQSGVVSLTYKNKSLGSGKFPKTSQAASGSNKLINVKLHGSTKNVPSGSKHAVSLVLTMELKAEYEAGPVKKNKQVAVTCDVKVKGLFDAKQVEIVSDNCESEFKN